MEEDKKQSFEGWQVALLMAIVLLMGLLGGYQYASHTMTNSLEEGVITCGNINSKATLYKEGTEIGWRCNIMETIGGENG